MINCIYCQQACQPIIQGPLPNRLTHCQHCNVDYYTNFHVINCTLNGKKFSVTYMDDHPNHWTTVYQHSIISSSSGHNISDEIVLSFQCHVKFTPQNFQEKLKLYLLFS
jgi:hypothetical protein